jgi:hypothetical protein
MHRTESEGFTIDCAPKGRCECLDWRTSGEDLKAAAILKCLVGACPAIDDTDIQAEAGLVGQADVLFGAACAVAGVSGVDVTGHIDWVRRRAVRPEARRSLSSRQGGKEVE